MRSGRASDSRATQRSKRSMPPSVVPSAIPIRCRATLPSWAAVTASVAARSASAPARSGSSTGTSRTSAAFRGSRSSAGNEAMGATAVRPATSPSQKAPTPLPSGDTTPRPVMTAARVGCGSVLALSQPGRRCAKGIRYSLARARGPRTGAPPALPSRTGAPTSWRSATAHAARRPPGRNWRSRCPTACPRRQGHPGPAACGP